LGRTEAQVLGFPNLAMIVVPHPIGGADPREVIKKAHDALGKLVVILTAPRERLADFVKDERETNDSSA